MQSIFSSAFSIVRRHLLSTVLLLSAGTALGFWAARRANHAPAALAHCRDAASCVALAAHANELAQKQKAGSKERWQWYTVRERARLSACEYGDATACVTAGEVHIMMPLIDGAREFQMFARACDLKNSRGCWDAANWAGAGIHRMHGKNGRPTTRTTAEEQADRELSLKFAQRGCALRDQDSCNLVFMLTGSYPTPQGPQ